MPSRKDKVSYFYDERIGSYYYGPFHPMKPHRVAMAHHLVLSYELHKHMEVYRPTLATEAMMREYHSPEYISFMKNVNIDTFHENTSLLQEFNMGDDCPIFEKLFEYCAIYSGASIHAAHRLNNGTCDTAINWSGGLHHAKKGQASGFCYVNDIVLAILELMKYHPRVLYLDIDIHHGDGVEEAFYHTDRCMTVSFHKYGNFFPGTGDVGDVGIREGQYYSINAPLKAGIDDRTYEKLFKPVMQAAMDTYKPTAVVLQCGADSLANDRLGVFNLTLEGHARCVKFMKNFKVPTLVVGGGGYNIRNVARCWAYETSVLLDQQISDDIPMNDFIQYYGPDYRLSIPQVALENLNSNEYLHKIKVQILEQLRHLRGAPSVEMHEVPPDLVQSVLVENDDPDVRMSEAERDAHVQHPSEYYDKYE